MPCSPLKANRQKMEVECSSETVVDFKRNTRRYIPEDRTAYNLELYK